MSDTNYSPAVTEGTEESRMETPIAAFLTRLLLVIEDLRYAVRENQIDDFRVDYIVETEPEIAEKTGIPPAAFVLPAYEMATLAEPGPTALLPRPLAPAPATAWELADLLQRLLTDCRGVRGIDSPASPRPALLREAEALLARVARARQDNPPH